jgi:hypothetical protein
LAAARAAYGPLALADVAQHPREGQAVGARPGTDRQLDRDLAAVAAQPGQLDHLAGQPGDAAAPDPGDALLVQGPEPPGDDHGQRLADDLAGRPAEQPLGAAVPGQQAPRAVGGHDRVHRRLGDRLEPPLGGGQSLLGPAPLDQGAELLGDPGDALQPARLAGPLVGDEQLQHRHHPVAAGHGHGHGLPDPGPLGGHGPVEPARLADVLQQQRLALGPGEPGQALAQLVVDLLAGHVQLLEPGGWSRPRRSA